MIKRVLLRLIDFYQRRLSGLKRQPCCRFTPTCSQYAREAIERYGALCGGGLALWRLFALQPLLRAVMTPSRSHSAPFSSGGAGRRPTKENNHSC